MSEIDPTGGGGSIFQISLKFKKSLKYLFGGGGQAYLGNFLKFSRFWIMTPRLIVHNAYTQRSPYAPNILCETVRKTWSLHYLFLLQMQIFFNISKSYWQPHDLSSPGSTSICQQKRKFAMVKNSWKSWVGVISFNFKCNWNFCLGFRNFGLDFFKLYCI